MSSEQSAIMTAAMHGEILPGEVVIDVHTHVGGLSRLGHIANASLDDMVKEMDRLNISQAITFHGITSDFIHGNTVVAQAVSRYPDRFVGMATVNPHYRLEIEHELNRCRDLGMRGVYLVADYQMYPSDGPNLFPAFEFIHEHAWIAIAQDWGPPVFLDNLATTFGNACFIVGRYTHAYADLVMSHDNIFQCTTGGVNFGDIEKIVDVVTADKLLFGSNYPEHPVMFSMGPILYARISDEDKRKILGLNAKGILEKWKGK